MSWNKEYIENLPDEAFAYIAPGFEKSGSKTVSEARYFPHHTRKVEDGTANDDVDLTQLRNSLASVATSPLSSIAKERAKAHLVRHAIALGVGNYEQEALEKGWITYGGRHIFIGEGGGKGGKGKKGTKGKKGWQPKGTQKEAEEFSKDSKITATLFHGTGKEGASGIGKTGFKVSSGGFGSGIYLSDSRAVAGKYAGINTGPTVLNVKLNVKRVMTTTNKMLLGEAKTFGSLEKYIKVVKNNGYDAMYIKKIMAPAAQGTGYIIVFNPKNVMVYE